MATLFAIGEELQRLQNAMVNIDGDGELTEEQAELFDQWFKDVATDEAKKLDSMANLIKRFESEVAAAKAEQEQYRKHAAVRLTALTRIKERIKEHLQATNRKSVETASGRMIRIQGNGGKKPMVIRDGYDAGNVPAEYVLTEIVQTIDKEAVRKALEAGEVLNFATLEERGTQLKIS